jgi:hypothetical protein
MAALWSLGINGWDYRILTLIHPIFWEMSFFRNLLHIFDHHCSKVEHTNDGSLGIVKMTNAYVEPRPKGRLDGAENTHYVLEFAGGIYDRNARESESLCSGSLT